MIGGSLLSVEPAPSSGTQINRVRLLRNIITDYDNETFDTGRALVVAVILAMCFLAGWDVVVHGAAFIPQEFGTGAGALLVGLGAYLFGDGKSRP